jgi:hypothetical protein
MRSFPVSEGCGARVMMPSPLSTGGTRIGLRSNGNRRISRRHKASLKKEIGFPKLVFQAFPSFCGVRQQPAFVIRRPIRAADSAHLAGEAGGISLSIDADLRRSRSSDHGDTEVYSSAFFGEGILFLHQNKP